MRGLNVELHFLFLRAGPVVVGVFFFFLLQRRAAVCEEGEEVPLLEEQHSTVNDARTYNYSSSS